MFKFIKDYIDREIKKVKDDCAKADGKGRAERLFNELADKYNLEFIDNNKKSIGKGLLYGTTSFRGRFSVKLKTDDYNEYREVIGVDEDGDPLYKGLDIPRTFELDDLRMWVESIAEHSYAEGYEKAEEELSKKCTDPKKKVKKQ
jgi:hypothetical protein